ncbi:MAG: ATP-binding protein [Pseudomonadota bacterium]|nr:ATP-binding protein [Pseudomonadota bacterium]
MREALSNVVRHANARHAKVRLALRDLDGNLEVEVEDDGGGIDRHTDHARPYGMTIMRERTLSLDGEIDVESAPGGGTRVRLCFRHRSAGIPETSVPASLGAMH